jgi:hypothetical protein
VNPVPPPPPPVFNPSPPNTTMPQSPEPPVPPSSEAPAPQSPVTPASPSSATPVSPGNSSALPESEVGAPSVGGPPSATTSSQQQAVPSTTVTSKAATARRVRYSHRHHRLSGSRRCDGAAGARVVGTAAGPNYYTPSYYFPFRWGHGWYSCFWHREWDGVWFHDCI